MTFAFSSLDTSACVAYIRDMRTQSLNEILSRSANGRILLALRRGDPKMVALHRAAIKKARKVPRCIFCDGPAPKGIPQGYERDGEEAVAHAKCLRENS